MYLQLRRSTVRGHDADPLTYHSRSAAVRVIDEQALRCLLIDYFSLRRRLAGYQSRSVAGVESGGTILTNFVEVISMTSYAGIDYSGPGSTVNRDSETGIRYGMISQNSLNQDAAAEVYYNGSDLGFEENKENLKKAISAAIQSAAEEHGASVNDPDEAAQEIVDNVEWQDSESGPFMLEADGVKVQTTSNNELWVFKSPFYTKAQFCSPCVPGAGNLDCFCSDGPKTYCLPVDWFENEIAPYDIWSVETDELVWSRPVVES